ncbi:SusC/RagA family TonB-linked outer membrane protein [uncultured Alistipes sp.]|uniref:SusC/RagA family TonB-linked outer membrane protein n=1 Tax=uncultured Alistipes sp. TaxID=538949 RepID=UPI0026077AA8|nr:SusC/RagA family TonB-linked outer membrane protein [uncultured Alistipes sp.]
MKPFYIFRARAPRRLLLSGVAAGCTLLSGIPEMRAQQAPGKTHLEASLNDPGARGAVGAGALKPEPATALGLDELLSGASGVWVRPSDGAPGASFNVLIRGLKSFRGTAEPLYILDGVMLNPVTQDAAGAFRQDENDYQAPQNVLASIAPADIERIEVLRDAAATAVYGSQGANGVVVITTRMGRERGERVDYRSDVGFSLVGHMPEMLSGDEYLAMMRQANPGVAWVGTPADAAAPALRTALRHNHYASVQGSGERMRHFLSLGYDSEQGVVRRTEQCALRARVNLERKMGREGLLGMRSNFGHLRYDMTQATAPLGSMSTLKAMTQGVPLRGHAPFGSQWDDTTEGWLRAYDDAAGEYFIRQALYFRAALARGLRLDLVAGIDYRSKERKRWVGSEVVRGAEEQGRAALSDSRLLDYNAAATFVYEGLFGGKHALDARLGVVFDGRNRVNYLNEGYKFFKEDLRAEGIQLAENIQPTHIVRTRSQQTGAYLSASYTYDGRYTLAGGLRGDYTFRYDNSLDDVALYPWVTASWNIAAEPFMSCGGALSQLRLRGGWGRSGAQAFDPYLFNAGYITGEDPGIEIENGIYNYYDIRWTTLNDEWSVGFDLGLMDDRLLLSATWYDAKSRDCLRYYRHGRTGDWREVYANAARVGNRGLELELKSRLVEGRDWEWSLGATFGYNRNRVLETGAADGGDVFGNPVGRWNGSEVVVNVNRRGEGVGSFYGYESQGIVEERHLLHTPPYEGVRPQAGDVKLIDRTGDGNVTADDRGIIGNPNPSYLYGLTTRVAWRNLSLQLTADGAADFDILDLDLLGQATFAAGNPSNLRRATFREAYPAGSQPRLGARGADVVSSRFVEDGSYLRFANIRLGYRFDIDRKWLRTVEVAFSARNVGTITGYSGNSPRVNSYGYDLSRYGLDNASYPSARTFLVSVHATF